MPAPPDQMMQNAYAPQNGGFSADQFNQWYTGQFGGGPSADVMNQIGGAVGTPGGPNGLYTQDQWNTGQQMAQTLGTEQKPFFPEFKPPEYQAGPAYQAPGQFQAPSMEQALQDPGYQFGVTQGVKALESSAAARGLARTGGTLKDIMAFGQQAAQGQYDKVYDRAANQYQQNYQMGRDAWATNEQQRESTFDRNYKGASDAYNSQFRGKELSFDDIYRRWALKTNITAQQAMAD